MVNKCGKDGNTDHLHISEETKAYEGRLERVCGSQSCKAIDLNEGLLFLRDKLGGLGGPGGQLRLLCE